MTKWLFILCIQHLHAGQSRKVLNSFLLLMRYQECCPIACVVVVINAYANLTGKFTSSLSPAAGIIYTGSPPEAQLFTPPPAAENLNLSTFYAYRTALRLI